MQLALCCGRNESGAVRFVRDGLSLHSAGEAQLSEPVLGLWSLSINDNDTREEEAGNSEFCQGPSALFAVLSLVTRTLVFRLFPGSSESRATLRVCSGHEFFALQLCMPLAD